MSNTVLSSLNMELHPRSQVAHKGVQYALAHQGNHNYLVVAAPSGSPQLAAFEGEHIEAGDQTLVVAPPSPHNAAVLRQQLPWLNPSLLGLRTSAGMGDRIGLATPGHVRAVRATGSQVAPIFPQQSIREMFRTARTAQQVMDDALWGIFQEGWQDGFGADADHLKATADIDTCLAAGFTFFTFDPGEHVDNRAESASISELNELAGLLPSEVSVRASGLLNHTFNFEGLSIHFDEHTLLKAAVKYGRAIAHVATLYQHLKHSAASRPFELEVSVDETDQPTTHAEHVYIATLLKRLGVDWVSLAPRYIGRFEKGVDYIGDVAAFEADIAGHAAIARQLGPYKLSLHSGSDKFSIYAAAMRQTRGLVHLKTAGTSYLEALRTVAELDPAFFLDIYAFSREHYLTDRASYHVSGELTRAPKPEEVQSLPSLLDQFDARQIFHICFGSVLTYQLPNGQRPFFDHLMDLLSTNPEAYAANLERHFIHHLKYFSTTVS